MLRAGWVLPAALALGCPAFAADLPARTAPPPVVALPVALPWDGFYSGFGVGYQWTRVRSREPGAIGRYDLDGVTSSSFIGRNWQFGSFVAGLEGEIGIHETKGRLPTGGPTTGAQGDQLWSAGGRMRIGYAFGQVLPFFTAGVATTQFNQHSLVVNQDSDLNRHLGFTLGAGVEVAWTQRLSTRFEYEYADFDRATYRHDGVNHRVDLATHAVKGSLVFRDAPSPLPSGVLAPGRGGSYLGAVGAYGFGDADFARPRRAGRTSFDFDGFEGGIFGGYDLNLGNWFVGYDTHVLGSAIDGRGTGPAGPMALEVLWTGSTRARVGTSFGAFSPYLAGGFSLAQINVKSLGTRQEDVEMAYGGTLGAGVDYAITSRWFARAEYAYTRYAEVEPRVDAAVNRLDLDRHDVRIGIGYRLGEGW